MTRTVAIDELRPLYKSMRSHGQGRVKFAYTHGKVTFDVIFFIDDTPFSLLFGAKKHNLAFELEVREGFLVVCELQNDIYKALCKALGLSYDPENPFSIRAFLKQFASSIPTAFNNALIAHPQYIAIYRSDVEDNKKIYFCGWRDNDTRGEQVTQSNLYKTKRLLGDIAHKVCQKKNLSSCWTDDQSRAISVFVP